jgi:hypothetical protein
MADRNEDARSGDRFREDLQRDNARRTGHPADDRPADDGLELTSSARHDPAETDQGEFPQHARKGQAESPVEQNHYEPPKKKEGHGQPHPDR